VETIQHSGDHLLKLINDVLDLSKIEAGRMELEETDFDLGALLRTLGMMFSLHCGEKGLSWWMEGVGEAPLPVRGDETKLRQVLVNLLGNAVKFTREGEVGLYLERLGAEGYRFAVYDRGPGISEEDRVRLFQPFQQGQAGQQRGGTGLGLALARRQVALMGEGTGGGLGARGGLVLLLHPDPAAGPAGCEPGGAGRLESDAAAGSRLCGEGPGGE
jgi:signal transduction histidine kinase